MADYKETVAKIKKAQLILIIPIILCFIAMILLGVARQMDFYPIPCVALITLSIVEIVLVVKRKNLSKQPEVINKQPKTSNPSSTYTGPHPDYAKAETKSNSVDDLPINVKARKKIWEFDAFVRDNYPNLPLNEISFSQDELKDLISNVNNKGILNADILMPIVKKMLKHLNQTFNYASVEVRRVEPGQVQQAGHIESTTHKIVVNYDGRMTYRTVLALLAHELSHAYQFYEFSKYPDEKDVEFFTDFLTYYLGFGSLIEEGYKYGYFDSEHREHKVRLGYLDDYALSFSRTTMNGRKAMKEMALEEAGEIKIIKNKINQINNSIPEYLKIISSYIENLTNCKSLSSDDLSIAGRAVGEFESMRIEVINTINDRAVKETKLNKLKSIQKEMDAKAKQVFDLYMLFSELNDKYFSQNQQSSN